MYIARIRLDARCRLAEAGLIVPRLADTRSIVEVAGACLVYFFVRYSDVRVEFGLEVRDAFWFGRELCPSEPGDQTSQGEERTSRHCFACFGPLYSGDGRGLASTGVTEVLTRR